MGPPISRASASAAAQGTPRVEFRKRLVDIENRTDPYEAFPADPCQGVVDGALEPFDVPSCIQADWQRQPTPLTERRYGVCRWRPPGRLIAT